MPDISIPIMKPYFTNQEYKNVAQVMQSGWVAQGPQVARFEKLIAEHEGCTYATATTSCTTAMHLVLLAMGIDFDDEVMVPSFTFIATANAVRYCGAHPVLLDIDLETYNLSATSLIEQLERDYRWDSQQEALINLINGRQLKAIITVNLFGLCSDLVSINNIASTYRLGVLQDSACALGARLHGRPHTQYNNPCCISFHPRKSITTGEGGMVLTNDAPMAAAITRLRSHGASVSEHNRHQKAGYVLPEYDELGFNYRMTDIQAAMGIAQMEKLDWIIEERRKRARIYQDLLAGLEWLICPSEPDGYYHTYQSFVALLDYRKAGCKSIEDGYLLRNRLMAYLEEHGVATRQGTHAIHTLGYYRNMYRYKPDHCLNAYLADRLSIALPLYVDLSEDEQQYIVDIITKFK